MYRILFTASYTKRACRFLKRHPELAGQYEKALRLLAVNPFHPSLRLHKLGGRLCMLHSISINMSYRITLEFLLQGADVIVPIDVGSHDDVY